MGAIYTNYVVPQSTNFDATPAAPERTGRAHTTYLLIPTPYVQVDVAWGDASAKSAAKNGGLSKIYYSDSEYLRILGIFQRYTTIVYGE